MSDLAATLAPAATAPRDGEHDTTSAVAALERKRARKAREERARERARKAREARAAKKAARGGPAPASAAASARDDDASAPAAGLDPAALEALQRDAAYFLGVFYRLVGLTVGVFGLEWTAPTRAACHEDAAALVPLLLRVPALGRVVGVVAAPFAIVERIAASTRRPSAPPAPAPKSEPAP